ncbi:MAG: flagellar assembly regulator FliX [Pseudorhodoplanes sp.]|nr:Flagellar assembly protein FliX [Pseudorhodoplanes sp.]MCL4711382.1 flagellar assembly regulator FliX [Pseudorhodoplanes sp.]MCQ3944100.1 flagellar assembly regulator FliX [Alphaproteobacteria bacterium]GIK79214.1 MAG: flagellar assembly protein FliX [Alphaproteobacteria bacterium]
MRIQAPNSTASLRDAQAPRRTGASGFQLEAGDNARPQSAVPSLRTIGGIDALVALQGMEDPAERRRRAVTSGRVALDALDELKLGLLSGSLESSNLNRLRAVEAQLKERTGEAGLDSVLAEIELRVAVEVAKMSPR